MSITRLKDTLSRDKRHPFGVMDSYAEMMSKANGKPLPSPLTHATLGVAAQVNHSRWIAECPFCTGAEYADPADPRFFCHGCQNAQIGGLWLQVAFPRNIEAIEAELVKRPDPENRNWIPGETIADLKTENKVRGIE